MAEPLQNPPWAPRVPQELIRRLYETDARGIHDERLIDEVGYGLLCRCESIILATEGARGRVTCPRCRATIQHRFNQERNVDLECGTCGWTMNWWSWKKSYQRKQLAAGGMDGFVREYLRDFPKAGTPRDKMMLIDRLIHRWHWEMTNKPTRPGAVNLIEGRIRDVTAFLDGITYSDKSTPGLQTNRQGWRNRKAVAANLWAGSADTETMLISPNARERQTALRQLAHATEHKGQARRLIEKGLRDVNRRVRKTALLQLMQMDFGKRGVSQRLSRTVVSLLDDRSRKVRLMATVFLTQKCPSAIALDVAVKSFLAETDPVARAAKERLLAALTQD
jgi:hypothetical protein